LLLPGGELLAAWLFAAFALARERQRPLDSRVLCGAIVVIAFALLGTVAFLK
jgi:hypothetical protein